MLHVIRILVIPALVFVSLSTTRLLPIARGQGENMNYLPFNKSRLRPFKLNRIEMRADLRGVRAINVAGVQIQEEKAAGVENEAEGSIHLSWPGRVSMVASAPSPAVV